MNKELPIDGDFFESLNSNDVLYCKTDLVEKYFNISRQYKILLTHNSDKNITLDMYDRFVLCNKFKYWLALNITIRAERLISIPIGFERKRWCRFDKFSILQNCKKQFGNRNPKKLLYANFSINTKTTKRALCINSFIGKSFLTNHVWNLTPNVGLLSIKQYEDYCNDILEHLFVLCPEGNGIDTHRLWETLYLGRIPVVLHNEVNDSFADMPILILNNWNEFEEQYKNFNYSNYSLEKLNRQYWIDFINNLK